MSKERFENIDHVEYWNWVISRRAHNNPRGDFIKDTRDILAAGYDPNLKIQMGSSQAQEEDEKLYRKWISLGNNPQARRYL